jgi:hypothetical protein
MDSNGMKCQRRSMFVMFPPRCAKTWIFSTLSSTRREAVASKLQCRSIAACSSAENDVVYRYITGTGTTSRRSFWLCPFVLTSFLLLFAVFIFVTKDKGEGGPTGKSSDEELVLKCNLLIFRPVLVSCVLIFLRCGAMVMHDATVRTCYVQSVVYGWIGFY